MPERRATRFLFEALFLIALAVGLTIADVVWFVVAAVMAAGWVLASIFEWASLRAEPHFGRGLPPRYFVPQVALPPPLALERPSDVFPRADVPGDAPTWIVPAGEPDDWPWLREPEPAEETIVVEAQTIVVPVAVEEPPPEPTPQRRRRVAPSPGAVRQERHRLDPLAPQPGRRRRRREVEAGIVEVPARPSHRALPGTARRSED